MLQLSGVHTQLLSVHTPLLHVAVGAAVWVYPALHVTVHVLPAPVPGKLAVHVLLAALAGSAGGFAQLSLHVCDVGKLPQLPRLHVSNCVPAAVGVVVLLHASEQDDPELAPPAQVLRIWPNPGVGAAQGLGLQLPVATDHAPREHVHAPEAV